MTRSYEAGAQARRDQDPDWRDYMPIRWHISRCWSIYWPLVLTMFVLLGAIAVLLILAARWL